MKNILVILIALFAKPSFAQGCQDLWKLHEEWQEKAKDAAKATLVAAGAASFLGPWFTVAASAIGASATAGINAKANQYKDDYDNCVRDGNYQIMTRNNEEKRLREERQQELERMRNQEI